MNMRCMNRPESHRATDPRQTETRVARGPALGRGTRGAGGADCPVPRGERACPAEATLHLKTVTFSLIAVQKKTHHNKLFYG